MRHIHIKRMNNNPTGRLRVIESIPPSVRGISDPRVRGVSDPPPQCQRCQWPPSVRGVSDPPPSVEINEAIEVSLHWTRNDLWSCYFLKDALLSPFHCLSSRYLHGHTCFQGTLISATRPVIPFTWTASFHLFLLHLEIVAQWLGGVLASAGLSEFDGRSCSSLFW